jgi:hypothetical protein
MVTPHIPTDPGLGDDVQVTLTSVAWRITVHPDDPFRREGRPFSWDCDCWLAQQLRQPEESAPWACLDLKQRWSFAHICRVADSLQTFCHSRSPVSLRELMAVVGATLGNED